VAKRATRALGKRAKRRLKDEIELFRQELPHLSEWTEVNHEVQRAHGVAELARNGDVDGCIVAAVDVLVALAARHTDVDPYLNVGMPSHYLRDYPLNLVAFERGLQNGWKEKQVTAWIGELAASWGIEAHLRVALRKLHQESKDTFLVRVTEGGLARPAEAKSPPLPDFTASRVHRAVWFLVDLGLASWEGEAPRTSLPEVAEEEEAGQLVARITPLGLKVLKELRG